jgi:hypothetical protein
VPQSWFSANAKKPGGILYTLMWGLAQAFAFISGQQAYSLLQARIATRTDVNLDGTSLDYFAGTLPRAATELDPSFSTRIRNRVVAPITTGPGLQNAVNAYLAVATPLESCDVFDVMDDPGRANPYGIPAGAFAVELYSPSGDIPSFVPGDSYVGHIFTGTSQYRVWGLGNHGLGGQSGTPLVQLFNSQPVPENVLDPQIAAIIEGGKAEGVRPVYLYLFN